MSDDGNSAIVLIALLGNPFSPRYARARARGRARPLDWCALNVALYDRRSSAWSLTERTLRDEDRAPTELTIGASTMRWERGRLVVEVAERAAPFGQAIRGIAVLTPEVHPGMELALDEGGDHAWWPVAPFARIEVDFSAPRLRFAGHGYLDANAGRRPLESTFACWSWARARAGEDAFLTYDLTERSGREHRLGFRVGRGGEVERTLEPSRATLVRSAWGLARRAPADPGHSPRIVRSLEDGPFYARSLVETRLSGRSLLAMHEALSLHRLEQGWVRFLAGFRMRAGT